jgi:hypothetical protein
VPADLRQLMIVRYRCCTSTGKFNSTIVKVLDLVSQVRDVVLMNVYLDPGNSGGRDFGMGGI